MRTNKRLLFSVTTKDCQLDTFTVGGNGGSGKDTSNTGVRWTHVASGAVGEAREERSQQKNKERAWRRMAESKKFQTWLKIEAARLNGQPSVEDLVEESMQEKHLRVEGRNEAGQWQQV